MNYIYCVDRFIDGELQMVLVSDSECGRYKKHNVTTLINFKCNPQASNGKYTDVATFTSIFIYPWKQTTYVLKQTLVTIYFPKRRFVLIHKRTRDDEAALCSTYWYNSSRKALRYIHPYSPLRDSIFSCTINRTCVSRSLFCCSLQTYTLQ